MWHEYMQKHPPKLLSSTFTPSLPFYLFLSPHASSASSTVRAARRRTLPPRLPLELWPWRAPTALRGVQRRPVVGGSGPAAGGAASVCSGGRRWPRGRPARRPVRLGRKRLPANETAAAALQDGGEGVARRRLCGRRWPRERPARRPARQGRKRWPANGTAAAALQDGGEGVARRQLCGRTVSVRRSGRRAGPRGTCGGALRDGGERGRGGPAGWRRGSGAAAALQDGG